MENDIYHFGIKGMKWGVRRYQNKDGSLTSDEKARYSDDYKRAHSGKSVKEMSDTELRTVNNRLQMERQYTQMTKKTSKGKKIVQALISTAGTITAAEGAYNTYKKYGNKAIDIIGNMVVKDLNAGLRK